MASINLEIGGQRLRVTTRSDRAAEVVRSALRSHLVDDDAPLGFVLDPPPSPGGLFVLSEHSGFVLCRSASLDGALYALGAHLSVLARRSASANLWFRLRALLRGDSAVLALWPTLLFPHVIERRLTATGHAVLDQLALEIDDQGAVYTGAHAWAEFNEFEPALGHAQLAVNSYRATSLVATGIAASDRPTPGQAVHAIAASALSTDRERVLAAALTLASSIEADVLPADAAGALYEHLRNQH